MSLISDLTGIADAIREKTGKTDKMLLADMRGEIAGISGGGIGIDCKNVSFVHSYDIDIDETSVFYDYVYFDNEPNSGIKTDIRPTFNTRIEVDFLAISTEVTETVFGASTSVAVGSNNSARNNFYFGSGNNSSNPSMWCTSVNGDIIEFECSFNSKHTFVWNDQNHEHVLDGTVIGKSTATDINAPADLWIGQYSWSGSADCPLYGNIYSIKVIDNETNEILNNLRPIVNGFYDEISQKKYTNFYVVGRNEEV